MNKVKVTNIILATSILFSMSSCSLLNKEMSKDEVETIYSDMSKEIENSVSDDNSNLKNYVNIPIKVVEYNKVTTIKEKGVNETQETSSVLKAKKSGNESNFCLEMYTKESEKESTTYAYVKDEKFYTAEGSKSNSPKEITSDEFDLIFVFGFLLYVSDLNAKDEKFAFIGTSEIKEGFLNANKGLLSIVINTEIEYTTTMITLKKAKFFEDKYQLSEYVKTEKEVVGDKTTTTKTTIRLNY